VRDADPGAAGRAPGEALLPKPAFRDALEQQLGLRLEPKKAPVDVLVVDRFEKSPPE